MPDIESDAAEIDSIQYYPQANDAAVAAPSAGLVKRYTVGNEFRQKNSADAVMSFGGAAATELTIATGAITRTQLYHSVDTEADASSDNLDTISGGIEGQMLYIRANNAAREVVVRFGFGNIRSSGINDIKLDETYKIVQLLFDGTNWNVVGYFALPNDLEAWNNYPDSALYFAAQDVGGELYKVNGDEIPLWRTYQLSSAFSFDAVPNLHFVLNSATAFLSTINASTPKAGMSWVAQVLTAPGAGTHDILLPSGVTWDGTNRRAQFSTVTDLLEGTFISTTRFLLKPTTTGVTFAAS